MTILKNGTLVTPEGMLQADLAMENDKITAIGADLPVSENDKVVDCTGCIVFPGFIDGHTHLDLVNALGHTADNFETGTRGAVCGGTTTCRAQLLSSTRTSLPVSWLSSWMLTP